MKNGKRLGHQRFRCKCCGHSFQEQYQYKSYGVETDRWIVKLTLESCGIRGTGRVLGISPKTVLCRIVKIAKSLCSPSFPWGMEYEADELRTFVGNKGNDCWVSYALERESRRVVAMKVGRRTTAHISMVTESILAHRPKMIYTDGLNIYRSLIPKPLHKVGTRRINRIERKNLSLRHSLKRLSRQTIAYTKNVQILESVLKIYFWYSSNQVSVG